MMTAEQKAAWLAARAGKLTASRMCDAMDFLKNGQPSKARTKLLRELLAERVEDGSVGHYVSEAMQHGLDYEDEAVDVFVERYPQYDVRPSRFYAHPRIDAFGATPDREIGVDGLLEVKCPTGPVFMDWVLGGVVPEQHKPQMTAQLLCTGKSWVGFLAYNPRIRDENRRLFLRKYIPEPAYMRKVEDMAILFLDELDAMFNEFVLTPVAA
jgi:predicted phage-related endonuclease